MVLILGTKEDMIRQYKRIALHIQSVLKVLKAHKVQDDLKRGFYVWDVLAKFSLPHF